MTKSKYIIELSKMGDKYGSLLIECMKKYKVSNLKSLTQEQLREFYEEISSDIYDKQKD